MNNIILIGAAGHQGSEYFNLLKSKHKISALVDENLNSLENLYKNFNIPLFKNLNCIDRSINYETAVVCVPHHLHKEITTQLISLGKTVIKEKPLAISTDDIDDYNNLMKEYSNDRLLTIVQRSFNQSFVLARNDISLLGEVYNYQYTYNLNVPVQTSGWRADFKKSFGGVLIDMGYHIFDVIFSFFGRPDFSYAISSFCYEDMKRENLEDSINILMKHKEGLSGTIVLNRHSSQKKEIFTILGTNGSMEITPKGYTISDRHNETIKQVNYVYNSDQIKLSMFESYLNLQNDHKFLTKHFEHHCDIVREIENIYKNIEITHYKLAA